MEVLYEVFRAWMGCEVHNFSYFCYPRLAIYRFLKEEFRY